MRLPMFLFDTPEKQQQYTVEKARIRLGIDIQEFDN